MADYFAALAKLGIQKKVLHGGKGTAADYEDGTKVWSLLSYLLKKNSL